VAMLFFLLAEILLVLLVKTVQVMALEEVELHLHVIQAQQ